MEDFDFLICVCWLGSILGDRLVIEMQLLFNNTVKVYNKNVFKSYAILFFWRYPDVWIHVTDYIINDYYPRESNAHRESLTTHDHKPFYQ